VPDRVEVDLRLQSRVPGKTEAESLELSQGRGSIYEVEARRCIKGSTMCLLPGT